MLTALSVAVGYAFLSVPNVEFFTATVFVSGFLLGRSYGLAIGVMAEFIYSVFNPLGAAAPPLLLAQLVGMGLAGWSGGALRTKWFRRREPIVQVVILGLCGFAITLIFDVMTTLSFAVFMAGGDPKKILASFLYGIGFYTIHLLINTAIFVTIVPLVLVRLQTLFP